VAYLDENRKYFCVKKKKNRTKEDSSQASLKGPSTGRPWYVNERWSCNTGMLLYWVDVKTTKTT